MKTWKEESLLNEKSLQEGHVWTDRFSTKRTLSGYKPTITDRDEMRSNAADLSKLLYKMCDIVGGKGSSNKRRAMGSLEDTKAEFEEILQMFYKMLDDIGR